MIETLVNVRESPQAGRGGPDIIQVSYLSEQEVQSVIAEMKKKNESIELVGQVSMRLGEALPSLLGWEKTILKPISIATERYNIKQWDGKDFSNWVDKPVETGWYQLEERDVNNQIRQFYYFYNAERKTWLQGDYYGLRFLANWYLGADVNLVHHKQLSYATSAFLSAFARLV